eukprot:5850622-Prymnesium_polylepis.1
MLHQAKKRLASIERSTEREETENALKKAVATPLDLRKLTGLDLAKLRAAVEKAEELHGSAELTIEGWILMTTLEEIHQGGNTSSAKPDMPTGPVLASPTAQPSPDSVTQWAQNMEPRPTNEADLSISAPALLKGIPAPPTTPSRPDLWKT